MASQPQKVMTKNGPRYRVKWREDDPAKPGVRRQVSKSFARWEDARKFKTNIERALYEAPYVSPAEGKVTLASFFEVFIERPKLGPSTRALYRTQAKNHLLPRLGNRPRTRSLAEP